MTAEAPDHRTPPAPVATDDFAAIPILLEAVAEAPAPPQPPASLTDVAAPRALGRADQQSLFDDSSTTPTATPPARPTVRRASPPPPLDRASAAGHLLKARAPGIIDEIVAAHTARVGDELRKRLQAELESLLAEMSGESAPRGD